MVFLFQVVTFRFGTEKIPNPVDAIKFYDKSQSRDPQHTFPIKKDQVTVESNMMSWMQ